MLSALSVKIDTSNSLNLTDSSVIAENFFRDFLNLVYGYNLLNINNTRQNAATIDLGDKTAKICIQVTADSDWSKVKKTLRGFVEGKLDQEFGRLVMVMITGKKKYKEPTLPYKQYTLMVNKDIWDISDLLKDICDLTTPRIKEIYEFLLQEIKFTVQESIPKEIRTFVALIEYLSDEAQPSSGLGFLEAPDPEGKVHKRFEDYSDFLISEYQNLFIDYGKTLQEVEERADIGQTRIRRLGSHLKFVSDDILTECNGNAKTALNKLVELFKNHLVIQNCDFDECAIRFYLVNQLIRCNVFPNKSAKL